MTERERLDALARAAAYSPLVLAMLADAVLGSYRPGQRLEASQVGEICAAVEVVAQAGASDEDLRLIIPAFQRRHAGRWRDAFWSLQLRRAARRFEDPERYGPSPVASLLGSHPAPTPRATAPDRHDPARPSTRKEATVTTSVAVKPDPHARARALAAQVLVPLQLPVRLDGTHLDRLSKSSIEKFLKCPDDWRRYYLCRERPPKSPAMALGTFVDDTVGHLYREIIAGRPEPSLAELLDIYTQVRIDYLDREEVAWTTEETSAHIEDLGRQAIEMFVAQIAPTITEPIAVQREISFRLSPEAMWRIVGAIDIEERTRVRDTKVKKKSIYGQERDGDIQVSTYLLARYLEGNPANEFWWDILLKPGKERKAMSFAQVSTTRSIGQLNSTLVRFAAAARRMVALFEAFGPDQPWDFADPKHHLCTPRYCSFHASCPGGGGLAGATLEVVTPPVAPISPVLVETPAPAVGPDPVALPAPPDPAGVLLDRLPVAASR